MKKEKVELVLEEKLKKSIALLDELEEKEDKELLEEAEDVFDAIFSILNIKAES